MLAIQAMFFLLLLILGALGVLWYCFRRPVTRFVREEKRRLLSLIEAERVREQEEQEQAALRAAAQQEVEAHLEVPSQRVGGNHAPERKG